MIGDHQLIPSMYRSIDESILLNFTFFNVNFKKNLKLMSLL